MSPLLLLDYLVRLYPQSSKTTVRDWIKQCRVTVNGATVTRGDHLVAASDHVALHERHKTRIEGITLLYQDQDFVVIDKPAGLLSVAAAFEKEITASALLKHHFHRRDVHVVHRLDRETSGVMLFALHEGILEPIKQLFETHDIQREYTAIVEGHPTHASGSWQSYQWEDSNYVVHDGNDPSRGKLTITHYTTIARSPHYSALCLRLETGRKNQIRVHCQSAKTPVVGDAKYGSSHNPIHRLALHARLLGFKHPRTGKKMCFTSPLPASFFRLVPKIPVDG